LVAFSEGHCIHRRGLGKDNREYGMVNFEIFEPHKDKDYT
jgi:hypothetical protein